MVLLDLGVYFLIGCIQVRGSGQLMFCVVYTEQTFNRDTTCLRFDARKVFAGKVICGSDQQISQGGIIGSESV